MGYIRVPIETNPEILAQQIYDYIKAQQPNWTPADASLDVWIARALSSIAADNRAIASDTPDTIAGYFGSSLFAIPPIDSQPATADSTWTLSDSAGHTIPEGTFVGIRDSNGNLVTFVTALDVVVPVASSVTAAGEVPLEAVEAGTSSNGLSSVPELIDVLDWVQSIALVAPTGGGIDAEDNDAYLNRLSRKLTSLSTVPILPQDFANAALDADPGVYRAVALDLYNPVHNLLTADESSFETGVSAYTGTNATLAQTTAQAEDGTHSMSMTASSSADMSATNGSANAKAVTPGQNIRAQADFRAATTVKNIKVGINWYTAGNALIGSTVFGTIVADTTTGWTTASVQAVAPATAAKAAVVVFVVAAASGGVHYVDKVMLRHGTDSTWVIGGTAETNNVRTTTEAAIDINGNPVSSTIKNNIQSYITTRREQNWINHVMDPRYTPVDVTTTFKVLTGFDGPTVQTAVAAAISAYLNPANWGHDPTISGSDAAITWVDQNTVYYNELIALISNIQGVDRVVTLTLAIHGFTLAAADVVIDGPAGLTQVGTISATAV